METCTVHFLPLDEKVVAGKGSNLLQLAVEAGVHINASCGGEGACGKCRVLITSGAVESKDCGKISPEDYRRGCRLACRTTIAEDVEVLIPEESRLDAAVRQNKIRLHEARHVSREFEEAIKGEPCTPVLKKYFITMAPPSLSDNSSDLSRLLRLLKKENLPEYTAADFSVLKKLPHVLRKAQWQVTVTVMHRGLKPLPDGEGQWIIINIEPGNTLDKTYAVAFDIGTTTLWAHLIDMNSRSILAEASAYNPQIPFGDDVITRIVYSQKQGGIEKLQQVVAGGLNSLIHDLVKKARIETKHIACVTAAGNTVMTHLLFGLDTKYIRESPYIPVANNIPPVKSVKLGFELEEHAYLSAYPSVASYVGGDIVAGVLSTGMYKSNSVTLYMDIGTNGEIVLGNADWLMTASCSAGPAFEGGGLKCGMRASPGAIEGFSINDASFEPMVVTIGRAKAKGICGSGAINILAEFLRTGIIGQNGKFNLSSSARRIRDGSEGKEYVLAFKEETGAQADVVITEADIDNLIRAKAAMFAGCHSLIEKAGLSFQALDRIIIAGAFGDYIDLEKAIAIGLLPDIPRDRYIFVGNGSLLGARFLTFSCELSRDAAEIAGKMTNIELSEDASFMEKYIAGMFLPHTDIKLFPSVSAWLTVSGKQ